MCVFVSPAVGGWFACVWKGSFYPQNNTGIADYFSGRARETRLTNRERERVKECVSVFGWRDQVYRKCLSLLFHLHTSLLSFLPFSFSLLSQSFIFPVDLMLFFFNPTFLTPPPVPHNANMFSLGGIWREYISMVPAGCDSTPVKTFKHVEHTHTRTTHTQHTSHTQTLSLTPVHTHTQHIQTHSHTNLDNHMHTRTQTNTNQRI